MLMGKKKLEIAAYKGRTLLSVVEQCEAEGEELNREIKLQIMSVAKEFLIFFCNQSPYPSTAEKKLLAQWIVRQCPCAGPLVSNAARQHF